MRVKTSYEEIEVVEIVINAALAGMEFRFGSSTWIECAFNFKTLKHCSVYFVVILAVSYL